MKPPARIFPASISVLDLEALGRYLDLLDERRLFAVLGFFLEREAQRCERGCAAGPTCDPSDTACVNAQPQCVYKDGPLGSCPLTGIASYEGERGCCLAMGPEQIVTFHACEGE